MRATWGYRLKETFAIGDGAIERSLRGSTPPVGDSIREHARYRPLFADNLGYIRLIGATHIAFGLWLALRQYRDGLRSSDRTGP
jgi:hypothetical protein